MLMSWDKHPVVLVSIPTTRHIVLHVYNDAQRRLTAVCEIVLKRTQIHFYPVAQCDFQVNVFQLEVLFVPHHVFFLMSGRQYATSPGLGPKTY